MIVDIAQRKTIGSTFPGKTNLGRGSFSVPLKDHGYRRTIRRNGLVLAGPSAPPPSYRHTKKMVGVRIVVTADSWSWPGDGVTRTFPLTPTLGPGPGFPFGLHRNQPRIWPPYTSGIITVNGFNGGIAGAGILVQLVAIFGFGDVIIMPNGAFKLSRAMNSTDIGTLNAGHYSDNSGGGVIQTNPDTKIWSITWELIP